MTSAGLNGLGRFGLHLLRSWLDRPDSPVRILAINDAYHSLDSAVNFLAGNGKVSFSDCEITADVETLVIAKPGQSPLHIHYTHGPAAQAAWRGRTDWWLECSGAHPTAQECRQFLTGRTRRVLVSATCWDADQTLVFGFNQDALDPAAEVISYGSCTVNAFVPLANWLHRRHGVVDAEVSVIHSVVPHRLADQHHPERRACTLERMGPRLLPFLRPDSFWVDYVLIPCTGVSLIDFRFRLANPPSAAALLDALGAACDSDELKGLYTLAEDDCGPEAWALSSESAILLRSRARLAGDKFSLPAYFDNENSATRYLDLLESLVLRPA